MIDDKFSIINGEKTYSGNFKPQKFEQNIDDNSLVFCFIQNSILLIENSIPNYKQLLRLNIDIELIKPIGLLKDKYCFAVQIKTSKIDLTDAFIDLRQAYNVLNADHLKAAIYAYQVLLWNRRTQFCGVCGTKPIEKEGPDLVKTCPECKESYYPKISPAIIIAIEKNGQLLMAKHNHLSHIYTILAGFVNPGESLEECIHREVMEEAQIEIENIRYFSSQPWPFPDSLMIGFKADYKSGEPTPDQEEIIDLKWFSPHEIPEWGNRSSISRALIDDFIAKFDKQKR